MELPFAEAYKIKMVEPLRKSTREEREQWIKDADYNLFQLKSDQVYIDYAHPSSRDMPKPPHTFVWKWS